jgi:GAF domain-containing protein/two-component sensor histidine kinase
LGTGLTSQIARSRQPIVTDDYLAECERRGLPCAGKPAKAWLGVPLVAGDRVQGVLNVSSFQEEYRFTQEQVQVLSAIADQAALAIDRMRLYQEMKFRAAELATLNEVSRAINLTLDLPSVLDLIMNKVVELLAVEAGSLLLADEESGDLVFQVSLRGADGTILTGRRLPKGTGIAGHVVQSGQTEIVNDVRADPRWDPTIDQATGFITRSILCVPMISRGRVIGVIEVINHRDGRPFEEEEASLLTSFAAQAAVAIENARLYTQTDQALARRVEELSTMQRIDRELNTTLNFDRVMDMTLDWALRGTGCSVGVLTLYDESGEGMFLLATRGYPPEYERYRTELWPLDAGIAGRVIRTGEAALVNDVSKDPDYHPAQPATRAQLTVPIKCSVPAHAVSLRDATRTRSGVGPLEDRVIGVVNVESPEVGAFDQDDLSFIQRLADHAAIAIENARLYRETQRRAEDMALLYDISLTVSSHLALDEVLETVYERIRDVWDPPVFYIALYDAGRDALDFPIYVDRGERLEPFRQYLAEQWGFSAWIVRNCEPILIHDWEKEAETSPVQGIPIGDVTRSWLGVPLIVGDRVVGVMAVQDYAPNAYGEEHRRFLSTIASEVAIAIENARLHAETQRRLREQTALREAGAVISSALDLETVLGRIADQMGQAVDATSTYICTYDPETLTSTVLAEYIGPEACAKERTSDLGQTYVEDESKFLETMRSGGYDISYIDDPELPKSERSHMQQHGAQTILYIPLQIRGRFIGYNELWESRWRREFTPEEIALCQGIAQQAAIAIENARLYEGVKEINEAKSEFIDFVAHELKQPMTSMQGYAKMLTMGIGGELNDKQREFVQTINRNVDRMGKLVQDLLEISRLEAGRTKLKLGQVQLKEVMDETVTSTRTEIEARQHTLEVDVPDDLPSVRADRERLIQILTNLVSNAYKYTPEGGTIRIAADGRDHPETPPGHVLVSVSDTGIGMSPQEIAHLDEKFFRADHDLVQQQPGTGLGVSITRNLVELHGGEFMIESEPGKGSTFRFTVPIATLGDGE